MQDDQTTLFSPSGIDIDALKEATRSGEGIGAYRGAQRIEREAFWSTECEILVPAALGAQLTAARANLVRARLVLEAANGPTLTDADYVLQRRGVLVLPDVICNAGGVTVSYFEWVQDFSSYYWTEDDINARLETIMLDALRHIWSVADRENISLRTATFVVGCERVLMARQERGLYP
jgi:glutamate dehydrogenase (NAD(P)+)